MDNYTRDRILLAILEMINMGYDIEHLWNFQEHGATGKQLKDMYKAVYLLSKKPHLTVKQFLMESKLTDKFINDMGGYRHLREQLGFDDYYLAPGYEKTQNNLLNLDDYR
ncbi:hypothetical protein VCR4J2_20026 [Vibrio coralliirubri]|uniref:hypothetical protein n=1 Tax=Vibrio coralliirubri TaxID=1516159 RepID=UPI0006320AD5|nr:hypothetical protein [Vibrio coralliirubri]CDT01752.1 hypothetical protein VCR4J2_20026 [Vibrio coralliirubri]